MTSAWSMASWICRSTSASRASESTIPIPPVSVRSKNRPPASTMDDTRSRVTPAVGSTMLIRLPTSQLNNDDLPTFGRPTIATTGNAIKTSPARFPRHWYHRAGNRRSGSGKKMAKCDEGYRCEVCGRDVETIVESDLYLRYVLGEVPLEMIHRLPERHIACNPALAQYIVDPGFEGIGCDGPFDKRRLDG